MKITLIHNPRAGEGQDVENLVQLITDAGHEVHHRSTEQRWERLLKEPIDVMVAAGGDGTVRRVALAAATMGCPLPRFRSARPTTSQNRSACWVPSRARGRSRSSRRA